MGFFHTMIHSQPYGILFIHDSLQSALVLLSFLGFHKLFWLIFFQWLPIIQWYIPQYWMSAIWWYTYIACFHKFMWFTTFSWMSLSYGSLRSVDDSFVWFTPSYGSLCSKVYSSLWFIWILWMSNLFRYA
jgi:hypothetical protein